MKSAYPVAAAALLAVGAASAQTAIAPGGSAAFNVPGTTSLYQVFGHSGAEDNLATDAPYLAFTAGSGNVFTFSGVTGGLNCCNDPSQLATPEGGNWLGPTSTITGINGISDAFGNTQLPLVAMFASETDPFGTAAPAALPAWDANNPSSQAPGLYQVFFVGDGRTGFNDASGTLLTFTAPAGATRLYIGFVDAGNFVGTSSWYWDNPGAVAGTVNMAAVVPEPGSFGLLALGLAALGWRLRRRQSL
ncbi:PEP-CTERM sorting domain-containing protein [Pelomonas sp. KK5]|uniref:PEP-CTERM sorting domain-containing protein n=1 Tax=Pelomonas sp. KK5 TaxID=1855730 RepID=UPI00097C28BC|nr:PEP-CTERM sorting domain-containing protein [Pelomonas sp. KK5]